MLNAGSLQSLGLSVGHENGISFAVRGIPGHIYAINFFYAEGGEISKEVKMKEVCEKSRRENFEIYGKEVQQ
jgi:hypothetical protein